MKQLNAEGRLELAEMSAQLLDEQAKAFAAFVSKRK
ncbi:hypothetical protein SDC9_202776 [bioreactor metagenome]|uniref:Uncharacterized protein n=1 Tax=bioreactor metagenome TaxID=1076179 RepID=A0A645IVC8_9ZZZZ